MGDDALLPAPGGTLEDVLLARLEGHSHVLEAVHHHVEPQYLGRQENGRPAKGEGGQQGQDGRHASRQEIEGGLLQVVEGDAPLLHRCIHTHEVVIGQYCVGSLPGYVGAADAHGHTHVGHFEGGGVIDAITGDGDYLAMGL
jgi:hypothetical protein